jgi:uncharacterized membrane protein
MTLAKEKVWVGFFVINGQMIAESTFVPQIADAWESVVGYVTTKEVDFDIPEGMDIKT